MMHGYQMFGDVTNWFAFYTDYETPRPSDEKHLREAYQGSVQTMTQKKGTKLLAQSDVFLHGRLGSQFIIEGLGITSYMRAFAFGRRLYTLAVDRRIEGTAIPRLPKDVQQFFDSFTYWD